MENCNKLVEAIAELDEAGAIGLARAMMDAGTPQRDIFEAMQNGIAQVGRRYETAEYYIADLIMAETIFDEILAESMSRRDRAGELFGHARVVVGTVRRDIHELGKKMVCGILSYYGFDVTDLGVDVPAERFVAAVADTKPELLIMSGTLESSVEEMRLVIARLESRSLRGSVKVLLGGPCVGARVFEIGGDAAILDVLDCAELCRELTGGGANG